MKSSSLNLIKNAGIPNPRAYRDSLIHDWILPNEYKDKLDVYLLRNIFVDDFLARLNEGEFRFSNKNYSVVWLNSPTVIRKGDYATISLRFCPHLMRGYCLIREYDDVKSHDVEDIEFTTPIPNMK